MFKKPILKKNLILQYTVNNKFIKYYFNDLKI